MFGKRAGTASTGGLEVARVTPSVRPASTPASTPNLAASQAIRTLEQPGNAAGSEESRRSNDYYQTKGAIFGALIEAIDLAQLSRLDQESAREEIRDIVSEIILLKNVVMSIAEQEELLDDICNDVLGYGPLEPLLEIGRAHV